jgi:elongation factor 3
MIVGETLPTNLGVCKHYIHPNLRVAYVAQHAFYHVEQHMDESPVAYIQWRFKDGWDREKMESEAYRITPEEQKAIDDFGIEGIWSRRLRAGKLEYEVKKKNIPEKDNQYFTRDELLALGFEHLVKQTDEKIASKEAGLDLRPVTTTEIQKHLDAFGLPQEFGTYGKIRGLSGGQKVKLVLAAAFWTVPHLVGTKIFYLGNLSRIRNVSSQLTIVPLYSHSNGRTDKFLGSRSIGCFIGGPE